MRRAEWPIAREIPARSSRLNTLIVVPTITAQAIKTGREAFGKRMFTPRPESRSTVQENTFDHVSTYKDLIFRARIAFYPEEQNTVGFRHRTFTADPAYFEIRLVFSLGYKKKKKHTQPHFIHCFEYNLIFSPIANSFFTFSLHFFN